MSGFLSAIDPRYLTEGELAAFQKGYKDCQFSWKEKYSTSTNLPTFLPPVGLERYYKAGWKKAEDEIEQAADRKEGRKGGVALIVFGGCTVLAGIGLGWFSYALSGGNRITITFGLIGTGLVSLVMGGFMVIFGWSGK